MLIRRPDPFGQARRALRDRALCNKDFGASGTLNAEWRPTSDRVNDFRCRLRAREGRIGLYGLPPRTLRGFRDRRRPETVAHGAGLLRAALSRYVATAPAQASTNFLHSAAEPRLLASLLEVFATHPIRPDSCATDQFK